VRDMNLLNVGSWWQPHMAMPAFCSAPFKLAALLIRVDSMPDVKIEGPAFNLFIERQVYLQYVLHVVEIRVRLAAPLA
jgi:hypothetical protein